MAGNKPEPLAAYPDGLALTAGWDQAGGLGPQHGVPRGRRWGESSATIATRGATARNRARRWEPFSPGGRGVARAAAAPAGVATQGRGPQGKAAILGHALAPTADPATILGVLCWLRSDQQRQWPKEYGRGSHATKEAKKQPTTTNVGR